MKIIKIIPFLLFAIFTPGLLLAQNIDPNFNPNLILEDGEILNNNSMNLQDIQSFLQNKGSYLANYNTLNAHGDMKSAAEIIYDAANNNYDCGDIAWKDLPSESAKILNCQKITTVNPKLLLVTLEKEESLISLNPSDPRIPYRLDWAMGYGISDGMLNCTPYDKCWTYKSFGKQVNSAALQFLSYVNDQASYYKKAGQTYIAEDKYGPLKTADEAIKLGNYNDIISSPNMVSVTPQNKATAALYSYTPHVFNGNYNVYKLWNQYFPKMSSRFYPDGSIIKASGDPKVWLIEGGRKRPFASWSAYASRFKPEQIVTVNQADIDNYPLGSAIKFANYSLVQTPDKKIYLLVDKEKRPFADLVTFKKFGFNPEEVETAPLADVADYLVGKTITATSTYITGALLQDSKSGEIYFVDSGHKSLVDKVLLSLKYPDKKIIKKTTKELNTYATSTPILLDEGTLVKTQNFPTVYLISGGKKRPFADDATFNNLGYNSANVVAVSSQFLYNYAMGDKIQ